MNLQKYYQLAKPGIIYANTLTALAGYVFGSHWLLSIPTLTGLIMGLAAIIASACICNNLTDRSIDSRMQRTAGRALVTGDIRVRTAIVLTVGLALLGFLVTGMTQRPLVVLLLAIAYIDYTVLYAWGKRRSPHGTLVGCIAGAMPLVAGYIAAGHQLDVVAALLFMVMVSWQMAHFFGIAMVRESDYRTAGIPIMSVAHSHWTTQWQAFGYMVLFIVMIAGLSLQHALQPVAAIAIIGVAAYWLGKALYGQQRLSGLLWGRQVFAVSLLVMLTMAAGLIASPWLQQLG